jgi:hypothetical protein
MTDEQLLQRITINHRVMTGKPVIRGTRLTVEYILNLLAHGATVLEGCNSQTERHAGRWCGNGTTFSGSVTAP